MVGGAGKDGHLHRGVNACCIQHLSQTAVIHLYAHLKKNPRSKIVVDPTPMDREPHYGHDWADFYKPEEGLLPGDMPEPRGKAVQTSCFVDSDHAGDVISRRSRTGVLIFIWQGSHCVSEQEARLHRDFFFWI